MLEQQEPEQTSTAPGLGTCWDGWSQDTDQSPRPRLICCLRECQPWPPASCSHAVSGPSRLHPAQETTLPNLGTSGAAPEQEGLEQALGWAGASAEAAVGNRPEPWAVLVGFLCLFQGVNTHAHTLLG